MAFDRAAPLGMERMDFALACGGCALALVLSVTAGAMILRGPDGAAPINGAEHLAVFAQPARVHDERVRAAEAASAPTGAGIEIMPRIDYMPTAAIGGPQGAVASSRETFGEAITAARRDVPSTNDPSTRGAIARAASRVPNANIRSSQWTGTRWRAARNRRALSRR